MFSLSLRLISSVLVHTHLLLSIIPPYNQSHTLSCSLYTYLYPHTSILDHKVTLLPLFPLFSSYPPPILIPNFGETNISLPLSFFINQTYLNQAYLHLFPRLYVLFPPYFQFRRTIPHSDIPLSVLSVQG